MINRIHQIYFNYFKFCELPSMSEKICDTNSGIVRRCQTPAT